MFCKTPEHILEINLERLFITGTGHPDDPSLCPFDRIKILVGDRVEVKLAKIMSFWAERPPEVPSVPGLGIAGSGPGMRHLSMASRYLAPPEQQLSFLLPLADRLHDCHGPRMIPMIDHEAHGGDVGKTEAVFHGWKIIGLFLLNDFPGRLPGGLRR